MTPKIDSLSTVLHPHHISNDGIDLLSKLLQFDPSKRMTSTNALSHPFFIKVLPPIITTKTTPKPTTLFDLPIIPLSPFQLGEEYTSQWDILMQNSSPTVHNITRTTSYPNILYKQENHGNHTMRRSISDVSIPPPPPPPPASPKKKKSTNRLSLWAKKHIIV